MALFDDTIYTDLENVKAGLVPDMNYHTNKALKWEKGEAGWFKNP